MSKGSSSAATLPKSFAVQAPRRLRDMTNKKKPALFLAFSSFHVSTGVACPATTPAWLTTRSVKPLVWGKSPETKATHKIRSCLWTSGKAWLPTSALMGKSSHYNFQSYHSIKLLTFNRCDRTPLRWSWRDQKPVCHFVPLLPRIIYVAWLFDSWIPLWVPVQNVKGVS